MVLKHMKLLLLLDLLIVFSMKESLSELVRQSFLLEPSDQVTWVGSHVSLPCRVINKKGQLQWTRDDFGLGTHRNLSGFDRYRMTGTDEEGDFTLDIHPVQLEDDAVFQCQVGAASDGVKPIRSVYATLTVLVPPSQPRLLPSGPIHRVVEDQIFEIICESYGGKPASKITWFNSKNKEIFDNIQSEQTLLTDGKRYLSTSMIRIKAQKSLNNKKITCQVQNIAEPGILHNVSTEFQVHYRPKIVILILHNDHPMSEALTPLIINVTEGSSLRFRCDAEANPKAQRFVWFVDNQVINIGNENSEATNNDVKDLFMASVGQTLNGKTVKCQVTNPIGVSTKSITLNVAYAPQFVIQPSNIAAQGGDTVTLHCEADSNPTPSYSWFRIDKEKKNDLLISKDKNLKLMLTEESASTFGTEYACRVTTVGFETIQASARVFLEGPPIVDQSDQYRFQMAPLRGTAEVTCEAISVPRAQSVKWTRIRNGEEPITTPSGHVVHKKITILENRLEEMIQSTLIIQDMTINDFGLLTCTVINSLGTGSVQIHLQEQKSIPLLIIIFGVIGGSILSLALILICIMCKRTRFFTKSNIDSMSHDDLTTNHCLTAEQVMGEGINKSKITNMNSSSSVNSSTSINVAGDEESGWYHDGGSDENDSGYKPSPLSSSNINPVISATNDYQPSVPINFRNVPNIKCYRQNEGLYSCTGGPTSTYNDLRKSQYSQLSRHPVSAQSCALDRSYGQHLRDSAQYASSKSFDNKAFLYNHNYKHNLQRNERHSATPPTLHPTEPGLHQMASSGENVIDNYGIYVGNNQTANYNDHFDEMSRDSLATHV